MAWQYLASYFASLRKPRRTTRGLGYDVGHRHGSTEWMLQIPATFVIDQDGVVRGAFVEPDFTIRQEPSDILNKVRQLGESQVEDASASDE
jgi:hypothetical protein